MQDDSESASKRSRRSFPNEGPVIIEYGGRKITGNYSAGGGRITVTTLLGSKSTLLRRPGSARAMRALAEVLLRELAKEGRV